MANTSIYNAFERMWQHVIAKLGDKANAEHTHDDIYYTETEVDTLLGNKADATHNHDDSYYTQTQMDETLAGKKNNDFVVTITGNVNDGYTSNKMPAEIYEAYTNGKTVYAVINSSTGPILRLSQCNSANATFAIAHTKSTQLCVVGANGRVLMVLSDFYDETEVDNKLAAKASQTSLDTHVNNADIHFTAAERTKLSSVEEAANHTVVDSALSSSSENPVQNKVINSAISTLTGTVSTNTSSISAHTTSINNLQTAISEIQEITSAEVQALFNS